MRVAHDEGPKTGDNRPQTGHHVAGRKLEGRRGRIEGRKRKILLLFLSPFYFLSSLI